MGKGSGEFLMSDPQGPVRRNRVLWLFVGAVVASLLVAASAYVHSLSASCDPEAVEQASAVLFTQMTRYDDVYVSATNGTRDSIDYPLEVMKQILMDTQQVPVPACLQMARSELVDYMRNVIHAFQAFKAGEADLTIKGYLDESHVHVRVFITELERVEKCAPICLP